MIKRVEYINNYLDALKSSLDRLDRTEISTFADILLEARNSGRQVFIMGNGGSAATASHFAGDFNKGLSHNKKKRFKFICLNDNLPTLMAYANDVCYDDIFVEQIKNFLQSGDIVVCISGSGNSKNVVKAAEYAVENGAVVIGLVGYNGGMLKKICHNVVHVKQDDMQLVEDVHMVMDHMLMRLVGLHLED